MDTGVERGIPDSAEPFETWLLHCVVEAVEGGEVSATPLTDIHAAIVEVRPRLPEARDALALLNLAGQFNLPVDLRMALLAALQEQPTAVRERFLRRFVEAWLVHQRERYEADNHGGDDG